MKVKIHFFLLNLLCGLAFFIGKNKNIKFLRFFPVLREKCGREFLSESQRKEEFIDPVYGSCWRYETDCADCGKSCNEKPAMKSSARSKNTLQNPQQNYYGQGGCCCN